ncbi:hypothetical protein, partial [uncultured Nostoc sp.]
HSLRRLIPLKFLNLELLYGECLDCGHTWGFDEDDPDYDDIELCSKCHGKGLLAFGDVNYSCTLCDGRGSVWQ